MESLMLFWLILAMILIIVDVFTSAFLFVWISLGAFLAALTQVLGYSFGIQIAVFCIVSIIACSIGYPWAKKKFKSIKKTELMEEKYIGREFIAEEDIEDKTQLKLSGTYWTAYNRGERINKGEKFKIERIDGNKLLLKKI
ncbi:Membrane protein implicated in regulation of membrane protease activity [Clostridium sp. DSM 8431]|uniref:NfeD family protein n=1 Tax=Clostridium sp. DSM 8431 TaxID=1761781 RepID=UPI0008EF8277|nr:NfeD family protein [Clostridium sp. DSM 8431]SFU75959.1 Membrane protein implicated in regulation of membrane protease activity [Clostridium sp. DSM 8431]